MGIEAIHGGLFAPDFLQSAQSLAALPEWAAFDDATLDGNEARLRQIFERFPIDGSPNEAETEDDLIWPVLFELGWTANLRQQNLSAKGREDVPDGLLFADDAAKARAAGVAEGRARYAIGTALVEAKRWLRPLDRAGSRTEALAPSTQMLRYLRRADDLTEGRLRWGILTNGKQWRLYYQGARSVSEGFLEIDLPAVLGLPGHNEGLFALSEDERRHCLKLFVLFFGQAAFATARADGLSLHQRALKEGLHYEERVAANISDLVFEQVFPNLVRSIADTAPDAPLPEVRDAALVVLYRLLFILYAEDRALLPVRDDRYTNIGLRVRVREDIGRRRDANEAFSTTATSYWNALDDLSRVIDRGDAAFGLPPYNGGLFLEAKTPLLYRIRLPNSVMADAIDALSFEQTGAGRRYINYRSLSVQQLGSIYERLLEHETVREAEGIVIRPNVFARKGSGSYYTPEPLVALILKEAVEPLIDAKLDAFRAEAQEQTKTAQASPSEEEPSEADSVERLRALDPATAILDLKVCDPAMGSGHFLVSLVDLLSDRAIAAIAECEDMAPGYASPLVERIADIRRTILDNAEAQGWAVDPAQLDDRHIVRRMVLKRCVYGVDKNPMAVELAKVALWLHTFTVGAPLSFLDHHLRCGDSLFGCWVDRIDEKLQAGGSRLFMEDPLNQARKAAAPMQAIEAASDADIGEAERSNHLFSDVEAGTAPMTAFLSLLLACDWIEKSAFEASAIGGWLTGRFGDPIRIAQGEVGVEGNGEDAEAFRTLLPRARRLADEERFLHWQVAFPGVWQDWQSAEREGGFDAVIGNPPWDRIKLQQVEWFAARRPEIAMAQRAAERKRMIRALKEANDPLAAAFAAASARALTAARNARECGDYPLLARGDINLYSLFVERAMSLVKPEGIVGLLTPSGIASDKTAAPFFRSVATEGRLRALYDFENKKVFFPAVHASFKFCVFVAGRDSTSIPASCAFYLHSMDELEDRDRCFSLSAQDFARVNPNTGTAPIFRTRRDAELTTAIYERLPVLVNRSSGEEVKVWPLKYERMFDMTNDSDKFRTQRELEEREGAWPTGGNRFDSAQGEWLPLYEGKMVQAYDHRAASIVVNAENQHRPAQPVVTSLEQHQNPGWLPDPQFWVLGSETNESGTSFFLGFKHVTAATNVRSMIAALIPGTGAGNSLPLLVGERQRPISARLATAIVANLNSLPLDFVLRQKVQGQNLNWFIVEQLPVVPLERYKAVWFGSKTAAEVVREAVLELTYTAHDMAPFAADLGYVDGSGQLKPPFAWDEGRRLYLKAKLDAVFFHLYGIQDRDDIRHIYASFPIVERQETAAYGHYRTRDLCLAWMNAFDAGRPDAEIRL
ncbi:MAG: restriction endonuclease [Gammaproteobacteria bacterium]|nr:restriction endonuclease [Gammaproteobacteria bacterium]MYE51030.1 restriction endonuclease [Gammaproteobacteria bacterium]